MRRAFVRPDNFLSEEQIRVKGVSRFSVTCSCTKCGVPYETTRAVLQRRKTTLCMRCLCKQLMTPERKAKISATLILQRSTPEARAKHSQLMIGKMAGSKHWNWKGGKSSINQRERNSPEYKVWRDSVFVRDGWKCSMCPNPEGLKLVAHHIKSWAEFPLLRFEVDNGITICACCHYLVHKYIEIERESHRCLALQ